MVTLESNNKQQPYWNWQQERHSSRGAEVVDEPAVAAAAAAAPRRRVDKAEPSGTQIIDNNRDAITAPNTNNYSSNEDNWKNAKGAFYTVDDGNELSESNEGSIVWRSSGDDDFTSQRSGDTADHGERHDRRDRHKDDDDDDDDTAGNENLGLAEEEEEEDNDELTEHENNHWMRKKIVTTRIEHHDDGDSSINDDNYGQQRQTIEQPVMPINLGETASFGEITIANSKHVHVGNTNFYKGPVTIKQFVYTNGYPIRYNTNKSIDGNDDSSEGRYKPADDTRTGRISDVDPNDVPRNVTSDSKHPILPTNDDYEKVRKWLWTWRCAVILCVLALSSVTIVVVASALLSNNRDRTGAAGELPESPNSGVDPDAWGDSVRFIERNEWIAQPPTAKLSNLTEVPAPYVIISHTATNPCRVQSECVLRVRLIQTYHIESLRWSDIAYNFLIGGDGLAYVGRSWDIEGAHAFGWNKKSIGISVIGTWNDVPPDKIQLHALKKVIQVGVQMGKISANYTLLGHRQVSKTLSPGDKLYDIIKTWDHWSPNPPPIQMNRGGSTVLGSLNFSLLFLTVVLPIAAHSSF